MSFEQACHSMHDLERWLDIRKLLERPGKITGADFEPDPAILDFLRNDARVLVVGAGKATCLLHFRYISCPWVLC